MSLTHTPLSFCTNAPRPVSIPPMRTPWIRLQQARTVLKPLRSCTIPKTRTDFALRAAGVLGTCAQAWAKGAAADPAPAERVVVRAVFAVALAATSITATAAPASSQRHLRRGSLRPLTGASPARSTTPCRGARVGRMGGTALSLAFDDLSSCAIALITSIYRTPKL